jgi:hypothetical protein
MPYQGLVTHWHSSDPVTSSSKVLNQCGQSVSAYEQCVSALSTECCHPLHSIILNYKRIVFLLLAV